MKYYEVNFNIAAPEALLDDARDVLSALAGDAGFETFEETPQGLKGYVQQTLFDQAALDELLAFFPFEDTKVSYEVKEAEDKNWNKQWEQEGFDPIVIEKRCMIHDGRHLNGIDPNEMELNVEIDAHLAFGTGNHETTRMMVATLLSLDLRGKRVLDCGCGTGILGIVALKLGAKEAVGYDIDEWSVENSKHNAIINMVEEGYTSLLGDASVLQSELLGQFNIVMANINRNILLADMHAFVERMDKGATLLLSGFYKADIPILVEAAAAEGLQLMAERNEGEWACLKLTK